MIEIKQVKVFDRQMNCLACVDLPERVVWVSGRSGIGESGKWYKGIGTLYRGHLAWSVKDGDRIVGRSDVVYGGWSVRYDLWFGKFGIFTERMQWYFSDWIGGAGKKESRVVENSVAFKKSAVKVVDVIDVLGEHKVYVLEITGGKGVCCDGKKVAELLKVMLEDDWNFAWDKGAVRDINAVGLVTDVADLFRSSDVKHKFGTVYAVLYSARTLNGELAKSLEEELDISLELQEIPFSCLKVMRELGCDISGIWGGGKIRYSWEEYRRLVVDVLMDGVVCAGLEDVGIGEWAKRLYKDLFLMEVERRKRCLVM